MDVWAKNTAEALDQRQRDRVLPGADAQATFIEDAALGSGFSAELCHAWEAAAATAVHAGIEVTCLRLGVVLARERAVRWAK